MKRGFTLIELLAVIVILAVIALIATPIVLSIIKGTKVSATERTKENYLHTVENSYAAASLKNMKLNDGVYTIMNNNICNGVITNNKCSGTELKINMSGTKPSSGRVEIEKGKIVDYFLIIDDQIFR